MARWLSSCNLFPVTLRPGTLLFVGGWAAGTVPRCRPAMPFTGWNGRGLAPGYGSRQGFTKRRRGRCDLETVGCPEDGVEVLTGFRLWRQRFRHSVAASVADVPRSRKVFCPSTLTL